MKPEDHLPRKIVTLHDASLLPHLPEPGKGPPYALIPAPGLGRIMGYRWWQTLTAHLDVVAVFDAGTAPALAASALRAGARWVVCTCPGPAQETVHALGVLCGGHVLTSRPDALTLGTPPYNAYRIGQLLQYLAQED